MTKVLTLSIARTADGIGLPLPSYTSQYHMGLNLQVATAAAIRLGAGDRVYVPTGFAVGIPDGYCGFVVSLPDFAHAHGVVVSDAPSLISPADRGPLFVLLQNISSQLVVLHRGDVVAQLVIQPVVQATWKEIMATNMPSQATKSTEVLLGAGQNQTEDTATEKMQSARRVYKGPRHRFEEEEPEDE